MNIQRKTARMVAAVVLAGGALVGGGVASGAPQDGCLTQAEYDQLAADRSAAADAAAQAKGDARLPDSPGGEEVTADEQVAITEADAAHTAAAEAVQNATVCEDEPPTEPPADGDSDGDGVPDSVDEFPGEPGLLAPTVEAGGNGSEVTLTVHNPNDPTQIISTCGPTGVRDGQFLPHQWTSGGASITYTEAYLPDGDYTVTVECNSKGGQVTSVPVSFTVATDAGMPIPPTNETDETVPPAPDRTPIKSVPSGPLHV